MELTLIVTGRLNTSIQIFFTSIIFIFLLAFLATVGVKDQ
jgi:multisubunit Na+/H+ antiporter MnhF subunit